MGIDARGVAWSRTSCRTLVHELYHLHDIQAGKPFPRTDAELDL
ncbi:hypothetical protein ACFO1B_27050 [Dactylosporangium siamense]|nr:hypothetical protein [Dactylosporangium siamense]